MEKETLIDNFNKASSDKYLDKNTTAAGLGLLRSLLDTKMVKGGGPPYIKEKGKIWYKKSEALAWHEKYKSEPKGKLFTIINKGSTIPWNPNEHVRF